MSIKIKIRNTKAYKKALKQLEDLIETQLNKGIVMPPKNPDRIKRIIKLVELYWKKNPDQRLGQLITNLSELNDPFYMTDEKLEERLIICSNCGKKK